jgi:hypothetical protein
MLPPSIRRISLSYEEKCGVLCFPVIQIFLMLELLIVVHVRHTETSSEAENLKDFIHLSGVAAIITTAATLLMSSLLYLARVQEMRSCRYLDEVFELLHYKKLEDDQASEWEKQDWEVNWYMGSNRRYRLASQRLKRVMEWHDVKLETGFENFAEGKCRYGRWQQYVSQLRENLEGRKKSVKFLANYIAHTPGGPLEYIMFREFCEDILELEEDISQFWSEAWAPSDIEEQLQWDQDLELEEINACILREVPEALSLLQFLRKPNAFGWTGRNVLGFQIMYRRAA